MVLGLFFGQYDEWTLAFCIAGGVLLGVMVASATVARPSLDDVYLRHAGRAFEAVAR